MFPMPSILKLGVQPTLKLTNKSANDFGISPGTVTCAFRFATDGDADRSSNGGTNWTPTADEWMNDLYAALGIFDSSLYECGLFSVTYGGSGSSSDLTGPTVDTYHTLSSNQTWTFQKFFSGFGSATLSGTIKVREIANTSNEVTSTLSLILNAEL